MWTKENKGTFPGTNDVAIQVTEITKEGEVSSKWASWKNLRPVDDYYTGAIQGVTARKNSHYHKVWTKKRAEQTHQQRETASAATEANSRNHTNNRLFQDRNLSKKIKIKEAKIDLILKTRVHVPHFSRSELMSPQTNIYVGSGKSTSTELSDEEMLEEMGSGLIQDDQLTKE